MNTKLLFLVALSACVIGIVSAEEFDTLPQINATELYENVTGWVAEKLGWDTGYGAPVDPYYIYQGDTVYLNDTIDISGVVPPYPMLAYWNGYDMYDSNASYIINLPENKKGWYKFYIDPEIFSNRTGKWYKYNGEYEPRGWNLAFVVSRVPRQNITMTFPNGTVVFVNVTGERDYNETKPIPQSPLLPERHVADYVVAKGQPIEWPEGGYHIWVLGTRSGLYDIKSNNVSAAEVETLTNGDYLLVIHTAGNDTQYDARYSQSDKMLYPYRYGKKPVDVNGLQPTMVYDRLKTMLSDSDDRLYEYNLNVDIPSITINQADEITFLNHTTLDVRGYTNVANGTKITVSLDERDRPEWKVETTAVRTSNGNMSYYRAYVPVIWEELAADARNHTLTARTDIGGFVSKDFKVSTMPADSYKPNATLKYIEDRNPFVPTPTPKVIVKTETKTVVVTKTIEIPVTPSDEQVRTQQEKIAVDFGIVAVLVIGILIGATLAGLYAISVYRRGKQQQ